MFGNSIGLTRLGPSVSPTQSNAAILWTLPKSVPQLPHVEIAALMKTATEVGGDYYDFHVGADGALTIAIGDATGHGLKAGTVVAARKGLFKHRAGQADLVATLAQTSRALKQMNLRSLFMALTLVKLNGDHLQCSVAGMPPILIYRAATEIGRASCRERV